METSGEALVRVAALHALAYCERLFYLEEVEGISVADAAVFAGRSLHESIAREEDGQVERFQLESPTLGIRGQLDALRRRDGRWIPYEHKRGRARREEGSRKAEPWPDDRLQIAAYAMLLEEATGEAVEEGRIHYHADNVTVRVPIDEDARRAVREAVARARVLRATTERPPVTSNERLCPRCSLAPVCLPEEERLAKDPTWEPLRLAPPDDERSTVHVTSRGARVGRSGEELHVVPLEGEKTSLPVYSVRHVLLHGAVQITTQALHLCAERDVTVSWFTGGGRFIGTLAAGAGNVQRRVRQYGALTDASVRLALARRLVVAKIEGQLRFVLRATRGEGGRSTEVEDALAAMRRALRQAHGAESVEALLGHEGEAALRYFSTWGALIDGGVDERLRYVGRSRRPPRDRVSALLGFGYALLLGDVTAGLLAVGLEPALGFYHQPRSSAPPLALDLLELFRVPLVDMPVIASINRGQWDADKDFVVTGPKVWLSDSGRAKFIEVYERRKAEQWKHSVVGYSLSYARMIELEARLLEKEWTGAPGLFARFRLR
jgi:CRISPR-associated protein Cas1